ncbi:hypothetical protein DAMA08_000950 [Martiniozyma asiatica (nom. inval.)]|nr:hypothetical protein DAMA08_000950 [Martiniozyma asiatica]
MLGWIPGMIHAWFIILESTPDRRITDEETRIYVISPETPQFVINKQPGQTRIKFNHPEPFLESHNNHHLHDHLSNDLISGNLSPRTEAPTIRAQSPSPLGSEIHNYGAIEHNSGDSQNSFLAEAPPSYDNVMNQTAKQFS